MSDDIHPLAEQDVQRTDKAIPLVQQMQTLRQVSEQCCFSGVSVCPICGQELYDGERHECRLVTGRPE